MVDLGQYAFTTQFIQANGLNKQDFGGWLLDPGMLFGASEKWWGARENRTQAHEGLDLCGYRCRQMDVFGLGGAKIPCLYDGIVVGVIDDLIGQSVIVEHRLSDHVDTERGYCTIYGHTIVQAMTYVGQTVRQGEIIARVAEVTSKSGIVPHLHLSIGIVSKTMSYQDLDWKAIGDPDTVTLLDPLDVIGPDHVILVRYNKAATPCHSSSSLVPLVT